LVVDPVFKEPFPVSGLLFSVRRPALSSLERRRRGSATLRHAGQAVNPLSERKYRSQTRASASAPQTATSPRCEARPRCCNTTPGRPVPVALRGLARARLRVRLRARSNHSPRNLLGLGDGSRGGYEWPHRSGTGAGTGTGSRRLVAEAGEKVKRGRVPRQGRQVLVGTLDRMEGASLRGPETLPP
jgi:hypothetical protein